MTMLRPREEPHTAALAEKPETGPVRTGAVAAAAELQDLRTGPELDEARTAPVAIVAPGDQTTSAAAPPAEVEPPAPLLAVRNLLRAGVLPQAIACLGIAGLAAGIAADQPLVALIATAVAVLAPSLSPVRARALLRGHGPLGGDTFPRVALAAVVVLAERSPIAVLVAVGLAGAVLLEPVIGRITAAAPPYASNLPGVAVPNAGRVDNRRLYVVNTALALAVATAAVLGVRAAVLVVLALLALGATTAMLADAALRVRARQRAEATLPQAVADYARCSRCTGTRLPVPSTR